MNGGAGEGKMPFPERRPTLEWIVGLILAFAAVAAIVGSLLTLGYSVLTWLKSSVWVNVSVSSALQWLGLVEPHMETGGIEAILDFILAVPLAVVGVLGGMIMGFLGASQIEKLYAWQERRTEYERAQMHRHAIGRN